MIGGQAAVCCPAGSRQRAPSGKDKVLPPLIVRQKAWQVKQMKQKAVIMELIRSQQDIPVPHDLYKWDR
jgi:hypothetical protein